MDGHVKYLLNGKVKLDADPAKIKSIDCSAFVRYVIYHGSDKTAAMPDGSWYQHKYCKDNGLTVSPYSDCVLSDGWLRIAFIEPRKGVPGHVWLVLDGMTLESHGGKGPDRRAWDTAILKSKVSDCYLLAQTRSQHRNNEYYGKTYYV